jgi:hypothetical protein
LVTQFTGYFNDRSKNFTHPECEKQFYPKASRSATGIDYVYALAALELLDFSALLSIFSLMFALSLMALFFEIIFSYFSGRNIRVNNLMISFPKILHFSYKCKCANYRNVVKKFRELENSILDLDKIVIVHSEAATTICDGSFEVTISLVLQLNVPDQSAVIENELQAFVFYLDTISFEHL